MVHAIGSTPILLWRGETRIWMAASRMDAMPARATVLGDGQLGLVAADILHEGGHHVTIWSPLEADGRALAASRHSRRLPSHTIDPTIRLEVDPVVALRHAEFVFAAIPGQFLRQTVRRIRAALPAGAGGETLLVASATKGIEIGTACRPSEVWEQEAGLSPVVVSGPNIAGELARRQPAAMVASSTVSEQTQRVQRLLSRAWLRVYTNDDPVGVEICGALKNIIALAAGMLDGMGAGFNAKGMLLARGLAEIRRYGLAQGAREETFAGLAGLGDLATTCFCPEGRNRAAGESIARGAPVSSVVASSPSVIEGIPTAAAVVAAATSKGIDMPIASAVHAVMEGRLSPAAALGALMERTPREE